MLEIRYDFCVFEKIASQFKKHMRENLMLKCCKVSVLAKIQVLPILNFLSNVKALSISTDICF